MGFDCCPTFPQVPIYVTNGFPQPPLKQAIGIRKSHLCYQRFLRWLPQLPCSPRDSADSGGASSQANNWILKKPSMLPTVFAMAPARRRKARKGRKGGIVTAELKSASRSLKRLPVIDWGPQLFNRFRLLSYVPTGSHLCYQRFPAASSQANNWNQERSSMLPTVSAMAAPTAL